MESATVNAADQNSGQLSSSANVSDLGAAREALHTNFDPSIICEALSPSKFEEIHFPDTSPKAIINQILSILKKPQVVYQYRYQSNKILYQCKAEIPSLQMVSFYRVDFNKTPMTKNEEERMKKFIEQKAAMKLITGEVVQSEESRQLSEWGWPTRNSRVCILRSDGTRQTAVKKNQRRRATKYVARLNVSFVFMDTERAGGASDCWPISLAAITGWDDEIQGGPGVFEINILPEGNVDPIASSYSHKMSKKGGKLWNGRGEELVHFNLKSGLSQFVTYLEKVQELSVKPVFLVAHGSIDIPNLVIALDSVGMLDDVLSKITGFIDFEQVVSKLYIYKEFFIKFIF